MGDNLERADLREILAGEWERDGWADEAGQIRAGSRFFMQAQTLRAMAEVERRTLASALAQRDEAVREHQAEEAECAHMVLDDMHVVRQDEGGTLSLVGRIRKYAARSFLDGQAAAIRARTEGHGGGE